MNIFTIKKAELTDFDSVFELSLQLSQSEYNKFDKTLKLSWFLDKRGKEYIKKHIIGKNKCAFIAFHDTKPIGYVFGELLEKEEHEYREIITYTELVEIFVLEEYQKQHIGTMIIEKFFEWCKEKQADKIKVDVLSQNVSAIEFYKKRGFENYCTTMEINLKKEEPIKENNLLIKLN